MKTIELSRATSPLSRYASAAAREPVVITRAGNPVAAVVPLNDEDLETLSLSTNPDFIALIQRSRERARREGTITSAELRRRLGLKPRSRKRS